MSRSADLPRRCRWPVTAVVLAVVVLAGTACTSTDDTSSSAEASTAPSTTITQGLLAGADRMEGRYAHYDVVAYEGDDMKTLIISFGFTDLSIIDNELVATESFCYSEHRSDQPIEVEFSDAATQAIVPESIAVELTEADGRFRFFRPPTPTGIGIRLADPANDPLPTDPNDPRIADDDNDGKPGVTARIIVSPELTGEIYLARREIFAYDVTEQPDGSLVGTVIDESEQLVVGASDDIFLTQAKWVQHPDPALSPIILIPVDQSWDCARLLTERPTLFPPTPVVNW